MFDGTRSRDCEALVHIGADPNTIARRRSHRDRQIVRLEFDSGQQECKTTYEWFACAKTKNKQNPGSRLRLSDASVTSN